MKYNEISDPNRGLRDKAGIYLGFIYKMRLFISRPTVRVKTVRGRRIEEIDKSNATQHVITVITAESPEEYFEHNREMLGRRFNTEASRLRLDGHDILAISNKPYWQKADAD
jgi:hypothetical protein